MKIVYIGSGAYGINCLDALRNSQYEIEFIITQPARCAGRGRKIAQTKVALWAQNNSISCIEASNINQPQIVQQLVDAKPDLIIVIAFGQKICDEIIAIPPKGIINVHGSLLPEYRGAAPINWAIVNGDIRTGTTVATITSNWDAGQILGQVQTDIGCDETFEQLYDKLAKMSAPLLIETINKIENNTVVYINQDATKVTRAPKLKKSDGIIDFSDSAESIRNKIRGLSPWPGVVADYHCHKTNKTIRCKLVSASLVPNREFNGLQTGTLDEQLNIICGKDSLRINRIKPAGKKEMPFEAFVNGQHIKPGDRFSKAQ